jgi:hypothetical protein
MPIGQWITLGFMHDGFGAIELYADGQVVARRSGTYLPIRPPGSAGLNIGNARSLDIILNGEIDDVKIWRLNPRRFGENYFARPMDAKTAECWKRFPSFLGFSGRLTQTAITASAADDDNPAKGLVMSVVPFNNQQVQLIGEHPQLFVSNGTHAFYLTAGTNTLLFPTDSIPYQCGLFEGTPLQTSPPGDTNPVDGMAIWYGKALAGGAMFGWIGALAGFIWGLVEYTEGNYGHLDPGEVEPSATAKDETGDPGSGKVVQPAGLTVPLAGANLQDWLSQQGFVSPDGRRSDFIVDRNSQLWWPGDFQGGYQGRWGPRVEADPFDRRAAMKFPTFWRSFFIAFANGKF